MHHESNGGRLLNEALARRGIRRILIDELHTISRHDHTASMATYSDALAAVPDVLSRLVAQVRNRGHPLPQILGFSSTIPPAAVPHVRSRAQMASGARVVRCAIDRPELVFVRLPLPVRFRESFVCWTQRILDHLSSNAPLWALTGRLVIFCPTARTARRAAHNTHIKLPSGGQRRNFVYLGVSKMTPAQRSAAIDAFGRSPGAVLFTNEAWSHGSGKPDITMVGHLSLAKGPVEQFQRSGRGARERGEKALVVHVLSTARRRASSISCKS